MALGHLTGYFEKVLGRRVAVSLMQLKDAPTPRALSEPRGGASGSGPTPPSPREIQPIPARSESAPSARSNEPSSARPAAAAPPPLGPVDVEAAKANPLVQRAAELLGAKVVRITARTDTPSSQ